MYKLWLALFGSLLITLTGCVQNIDTSPDKPQYEITKKEAIEIALKELYRRGLWHEDNLRGVDAVFVDKKPQTSEDFGECWLVLINGKELFIGNNVTVFVSKQGEVIDILGGH